MDRRLFLTGMFTLAGAAVLSSATVPVHATTVVPRGGILGEIDAPQAGAPAGEARIEQIHHHRRHRRRRVWARICYRYKRHGRWRRRCERRRVWRWVWI